MSYILIIEDDTRVSELINRVLVEEGYKTSLVTDGDKAKDIVFQTTFDLIITDIILPKTDGIQLVKFYRASGIQTPILMLTALGTTDDKVEGFDAGADDYLVKPFEIRELLARVKALLKRNQTQTTETYVLKYDDLELNLKTKIFKRNGLEISLTPKEFNFLEYLMQNPERVLSKAEIAKEVWNTHFDTGTNFIDVYVNYLRKKIDRDYEHKLIHTKSGMGFMLKRES